MKAYSDPYNFGHEITFSEFPSWGEDSGLSYIQADQALNEGSAGKRPDLWWDVCFEPKQFSRRGKVLILNFTNQKFKQKKKYMKKI